MDLEGNGCGLIDVQSWHFGGSEIYHENLVRIAGVRPRL
jgi:hypothetical protein